MSACGFASGDVMIRTILMAAMLAMFAPQAQAAEIQVWCPALVHEAVQDFATDFMRETGTKIAVISGPMGKMVDAIQ